MISTDAADNGRFCAYFARFEHVDHGQVADGPFGLREWSPKMNTINYRLLHFRRMLLRMRKKQTKRIRHNAIFGCSTPANGRPHANERNSKIKLKQLKYV